MNPPRAFHALLFLFIAGCNPGPLDVLGLRCDDARACGEGAVCFESRCVREGEGPDAGEPDAGREDAGAPDSGVPRGVNLLANPGFEELTSDGGVIGWRASTGRVLTATGGRSAIR